MRTGILGFLLGYVAGYKGHRWATHAIYWLLIAAAGFGGYRIALAFATANA